MIFLTDTSSDGNTDGNFRCIRRMADKPETEAGISGDSDSRKAPVSLSENDEGTELVPKERRTAMEDTRRTETSAGRWSAENVTEGGEHHSDELSDNAEEETFTSEAKRTDFSDGSASEGELGTYQTVTLEIEDGQDITAPLNTLVSCN